MKEISKMNECRKRGCISIMGGAENKKEEAGKGGARNGPVELGLGRFGS